MYKIEDYEALVEKELVNKHVQEIDNYEIISFKYNTYNVKYTDYADYPLLFESRGHAFVKDKNTSKIEPFCTALKKFFNYNECCFSDVAAISGLQIKTVTEKLDGSLILAGKLPNGKLVAKTQSTINSEQAIVCTKLINEKENYYRFCNYILGMGYTLAFEYTSPKNQVVLFYPEEKLSLICLRHISSGVYVRASDALLQQYDIPTVKRYDYNIGDLVNLQKNQTGAEGYVVEFEGDLFVKFKLDEYFKFHKAKDSIYNLKNLTEIVLEEKLDDILPLINTDQACVDYVLDFKQNLIKLCMRIDTCVKAFYFTNRELPRKDYAIKATGEFEDKGLFGLVMNLYIGRDANIKEYILKNKLYESCVEKVMVGSDD